MSVTSRTLWLLDQLRRAIGGHADNTVRTLAEGWIHAWDTLRGDWTQAVDDLLALYAETGQWPQPWQMTRLERLTRATTASQASLAALTAQATLTIGAGIDAVAAATVAAEPEIMASQLPARLAKSAIARYAAAVRPTALEAIVARCRQQVTQVLWPLSNEATEAMRRALIVGIAVGDNPRDAARDMVRRVEGNFNGGLARATNIARTEMVSAYREVSGQVHSDNADVLDGWVWSSTLDRRTCPSCWAMHGTVWPLEQPGPWDHQQGRCARLPKAKSWVELGIPGQEEPDLTPDAQARFAELPAADQLQVMGPARLALLKAGKVTFADLAMRRETPQWRPSYVPRPVRDLQQIAGSRAPA